MEDGPVFLGLKYPLTGGEVVLGVEIEGCTWGRWTGATHASVPGAPSAEHLWGVDSGSSQCH